MTTNSNQTLWAFQSKFAFDPANTGKLGLEREAFVVDSHNGCVVPKADVVLQHLDPQYFCHELSACQIESRTPICTLDTLRKTLETQSQELSVAAAREGLAINYWPIGPDDMSLAVSPDAEGRYKRIRDQLGELKLQAACQVAGLHVHFGVGNPAEALVVYNCLAEQFAELVQLGDYSDGQRLQAYRIVTSDLTPRRLQSWTDLTDIAIAQGFFRNPRDWWWLVRISVHGTVEVRVADSIDDIDMVYEFAKRVHQLGHEALNRYRSAA